jgi:hypothetical protein
VRKPFLASVQGSQLEVAGIMGLSAVTVLYDHFLSLQSVFESITLYEMYSQSGQKQRITHNW